MPVRYGSLPFQEQIDFFRQKLNLPTEHWNDIWRDAHDRAFVVAGATKTDLLADLRGAVDKAISEGKSLNWFKQEFKNIVAKHGWEHNGPADWRSRVIFETNLRQSYSAGREVQIEKIKHKRPYALYRHGGSEHPRELHLKWNGLVLPVDDPWWETHSPINGYGCSCKKFMLSEQDLKRRGLTVGQAPDDGTYDWVDKRTGEVHQIPKGIDPGFDYRPKSPKQLTEQVKKLEAEKPALADRSPPRMVDSAFSTAKGVNAQALSDLLQQLPEQQRQPIADFLSSKKTKTLFVKQSELGKGKGAWDLVKPISEYLGTTENKARWAYFHRKPTMVNGFTSKSWEHVVVKVKASDKLKSVDMKLVQQAAAEVVRDAKNNAGPLGGKHWSISANVERNVGDSAKRVATWLHELGHQIHFYAGSPDLSGMGAVSKYGMTNSYEVFAEWFAAWSLAKDEVILFDPTIAKRIEEIISQAIKSKGKA